MELSGGVPTGIEVTRPGAARVFDYFLGFLGGAHHVAAVPHPGRVGAYGGVASR